MVTNAYQIKVFSSIILADVLGGVWNVCEWTSQLLHHKEDKTVWSSAWVWVGRVVTSNKLALKDPESKQARSRSKQAAKWLKLSC